MDHKDQETRKADEEVWEEEQGGRIRMEGIYYAYVALALILILLAYITGFVIKSEPIVHMTFALAIAFGLLTMIVRQDK